ncbi:MAG: alpha/beta hydrolase [Ferruginibacter sp.]
MRRPLKLTLRIFLLLFIFMNMIVIFHAYKFTHYYNQGEVTIKKQSDKTGWDISRELFFGFNAVKQINSVPDRIYKTIYLTTNDGLKLEAWVTTNPAANGTVAMFHGHGGKKSGILKEAASFREMGYNTLLLDFRAHGSSEGNTCTIGYDEAEDVKLAYEYLQTKGEKNIVLWGISLGAATITKAVNDYAIAPQKIILEMPFGSLPEAVVGVVKKMGLPPQPLSTLLTFWGGVEHGFWAFNVKPSEYVKQLRCPVLLQHGSKDPRVTNTETKEIFDNITTTKKWVEYTGSAHESLCTNEHEKWVTEVSAFLQK